MDFNTLGFYIVLLIFTILYYATKISIKQLFYWGIFVIVLLLLFGISDTASLGLLSSIFALLLHFVSTDFLFTSFKIEKNEINQYKLSNIKSIVLILIPLIFLSMYIIKPNVITVPNYYNKKIDFLYKINEPNEVELFYKNDYLKASYINYSFSKKPYIQVSKFKDSSKQEKEFTRLIKDSDLVAFSGAKEYKVTYVTMGSEKNTVWLELHSNNNLSNNLSNYLFNFVKAILISLIRLYIVFLLFTVLFIIFEKNQHHIYRFICDFCNLDEKIKNIQGEWYQQHIYAWSGNKFYLSGKSFSIRGNKLFFNKQQYNLQIKKNKIFFRHQNKNVEIHFMKESSQIQIGDYIFENKTLIKVKKFDHPRKSKKRVYYRLENQNNIFKYPKYEHVLYLDILKNKLIETRTGKKFKVKNKNNQKYLESQNIIIESKDDTLLFYNQNNKCIGSYEKME